MIFFDTNFKYTYVQIFFVKYVNKISSFNFFFERITSYTYFFHRIWEQNILSILYHSNICIIHTTYLIFWLENYQHVLRKKINCSKKIYIHQYFAKSHICQNPTRDIQIFLPKDMSEMKNHHFLFFYIWCNHKEIISIMLLFCLI